MRFAAMVLGVTAMLGSGAALAADHEIRMLDQGEDGFMVFEPSFLQIEPGDTVHFIATHEWHNAQTWDGLLPEGAEEFVGELSEDVSYTFDVPGAYGIVCAPHFPMGMVALIIVGDDPGDLSAFESEDLPEAVRERFADAIAQLSE